MLSLRTCQGRDHNTAKGCSSSLAAVFWSGLLCAVYSGWHVLSLDSPRQDHPHHSSSSHSVNKLAAAHVPSLLPQCCRAWPPLGTLSTKYPAPVFQVS
jgi:hypothetical protein